MEIKHVVNPASTNNSETYHRERKRYEPVKQQAQYKSETSPSKEELQEQIQKINQILKEHHTSIEYQLHEQLNEYYVRVVDTETNHIVREIPSKKLLDLNAYIKAKLGLIIDQSI